MYCIFFVDVNNFFIIRFLGFLVYILNIIRKEDGFFFFRDINYIRRIIFRVYGRYVIYYNNRIYLLFLNGYFKDGVNNEFCEVEVFGKKIIFYFIFY